MTQKEDLRLTLLAGIWILTLGGFWLHFTFHSPGEQGTNLIPFVAGLVSLVAVPLLFSFRRTLAYGYVINGMLAIIGSITMAKFLLWPDIAILWAQFLLGKGLFELSQLRSEEQPRRQGRFIRYPNLGYWFVHAVAMSVVFLLGYYLWV